MIYFKIYSVHLFSLHFVDNKKANSWYRLNAKVLWLATLIIVIWLWMRSCKSSNHLLSNVTMPNVTANEVIKLIMFINKGGSHKI